MKKKSAGSRVPVILTGGKSEDSRGSVSFVNEFNFKGVKRFYIVGNLKKGMVRAWHGHKYEEKYLCVITGKALVGAVKVDNWKNPLKESKVHKFILSSDKPEILYIPGGYANGSKSFTKDTKLIFFSTKSLEESKKDDIRFEPEYWDLD